MAMNDLAPTNVSNGIQYSRQTRAWGLGQIATRFLLLDRKKARGSALNPWSFLLENHACSEVVHLYDMA
ncbi:MAG: hypothetical protein M9935_07170, partial [Kiritimatiellae bacterium]|nr:hypothetical protein [Kiritimatiellia bacterium]